jgi:hypothetical protein
VSTVPDEGSQLQGERPAPHAAVIAEDGWVPVWAAAEEAGVDVGTLRIWSRRGLIQSRSARIAGGSELMLLREEVAKMARLESWERSWLADPRL